MTTVSFGGKTAVYTYDRNGNRASLTHNGSVSETYTYNKNNQVTGVYNKKQGGSVISQYTYIYDKAGRVTKVEAPGKTTVYAYDFGGNRASQSETYTSAQLTGYVGAFINSNIS